MINLEMPDDVRRYVLDYQSRAKGDKGRGQYSQQEAIMAIIREHKELTEENDRLRQQIEKPENT